MNGKAFYNPHRIQIRLRSLYTRSDARMWFSLRVPELINQLE